MTNQYTIKELYKILGTLIDDGYGDKEFQIYYDSEAVYTTIPKGSKIELNNEGVRFTDYDDGTCHIYDLDEIVNGDVE